MAARAIWKACVRVGAASVPVKLYSAAQDIKVHFRLLHAADGAPVSQRMLDPVTHELVDSDDVRRGVEVGEGMFVLIDPDERESLAPPPSRDIVVEQVVPAASVDLRWFNRPYILGPDGDDEGYFALAAALEESQQLAIARWVMRKGHYRGALHARDGYLGLTTLRPAEELVELGHISPAARNAPEAKELQLAEQLINALAGELDLTDYRETYQARVSELVAAKAEGRAIKRPKSKPAAPSASLADALAASLKSNGSRGESKRKSRGAKRKRGARKGTPKSHREASHGR